MQVVPWSHIALK